MSNLTVQVGESTFEAERGTPETIRAVGERLAAAGAVETWWHPQGMYFVRRTLGDLTADGDLVFLLDDHHTSEDEFGWEDYPDKAARHLVHADGLGVTFMSFHGEQVRTHRVAR